MSEKIDTEEKKVDISEMKTLDADAASGSEPKKGKKKKSVAGKLFRFVLLVIVVSVAAGLAFCAFDRKSAVSVIPKSFSFYVRTDSAIDTIDPMLDLRAADVFLSTPEFKAFRSIFMDLRSSPLRKNKVFRKLAARPVDAAVYDGAMEAGKQNFIAAVNLGCLSFVSRPLKSVFPKILPLVKGVLEENKAELRLVDGENLSYFELNLEGALYYFVPVKNLVVFSDSAELLMMAAVVDNDVMYTSAQKKIIAQKSKDLRVIANARSLAESFTSQNAVLGKIVDILPADELSVVSVKFSDSDIYVDMRVPLSAESLSSSSLNSILSQKSTAPAILTRMTDVVQYYTVLNAGSLSELKESVFPVLPVKDSAAMWDSANKACRFAFSMDIDELIFSWSGRELAVLGIENQNDPVFAVQVSDEKKRQAVFDKFVDSIFINSDNSLILDGVRLPRLKLPSFLNGLLSVFGISIPKPYYMVLDDFIYFSESPEALSAIFMQNDKGDSLVKLESWRTVSSGVSNDATVSLFYNLNRSVPFFLRSNAALSKVLELYTLGRFDVKLRGDEICFVLQANADKANDMRSVPGFPVDVQDDAVAKNFVVENSENPKFVFWTGKNSISGLDLASLETKTVENVGKCELVSASPKMKNGVLWAVSGDGYVYLCDRGLNFLENFPVVLPERTVPGIAVCDEGVLVPLESGSIVLVYPNGTTSTIKMPEISIKSSPDVVGGIVSVYNKSFMGGLYFADLKTLSCLNAEAPLELYEIGFGSPASIVDGNKRYTAFVTQAGTLSIWEDMGAEPVVSKDLLSMDAPVDGTFEGKICASSKYFYALSTDAVLYRISVDGSVLSVKIPGATARDAFLSVSAIGKKGDECVFVNADSNVIYGFNEELELLPGFPVVGHGNPVFADVDGDRKPESLSMSLDKKITACKLR